MIDPTGAPAPRPDAGVLSRDRADALVSSIDLRAGNVLLGAGARGGPVTWAGLGIDVVSGASSAYKLMRGDVLQESDKIVFGGYFEGSARSITENRLLVPLVDLIDRLLGAQGLRFEAGLAVEVKLSGDGDRVPRLEQITVGTILVTPQRGAPAQGYRDFGGNGNVMRWTFPPEGGVTFSNDWAARQGAFAGINTAGPRDGTLDFDGVPGTRGLAYAMIQRDVDEWADVSMTLRQGVNAVPDFVPGSANAGSGGVGRVADAALALDFARRMGRAIGGDATLSADGTPEVTTLRGWVRAVQALTPAQAALPADVPMPGLFIEANAYVRVIEDGIPRLRVFSSASSEPVFEASLDELAALYDRAGAALGTAAERALAIVGPVARAGGGIARRIGDAWDDMTGADEPPRPGPVDRSGPTAGQRALAAAIAARQAADADVPPPTSGLTVTPPVLRPGAPTVIGGAPARREWYDDATFERAQAFARAFNASSRDVVAVAYPVLDPATGEWMVELAAGPPDGDAWGTGITPSEARTLLARLREAGRLPEGWTNDDLFRGSGIGVGSTPYADLTARDAILYFDGLSPAQVRAAARAGAASVNGAAPAVLDAAEYDRARSLAFDANADGTARVALALPVTVELPWDTPEDGDRAPDYWQTADVVYLYGDLTPAEAAAVIDTAAAEGRLRIDPLRALAENGLSVEGLRRRADAGG